MFDEKGEGEINSVRPGLSPSFLPSNHHKRLQHMSLDTRPLPEGELFSSQLEETDADFLSSFNDEKVGWQREVSLPSLDPRPA